MDIEPYNKAAEETEQEFQRRWNGDLTNYVQVIGNIIQPQLQLLARPKFNLNAKGERQSVVRGPLIRLEAWWLENDREVEKTVMGRTEKVTLRGLRPIPGTDIVAMDYQNGVEKILAFSEPVRRRTQQGGEGFGLAVETNPVAEAGTPSFFGKEAEIGRVLVGAINGMPPDDRRRITRVIVHSGSPLRAYTTLKRIVAAQSSPPPKEPDQPAKEFGVAGGKILSDPKKDRYAMTVELELTERLIALLRGKGLTVIGANIAKGDQIYPQPYADGSDTYPLDKATWRATVKSHPDHPFFGGDIKRRALIVIRTDQIHEFFRQYGKGGGSITVGKDDSGFSDLEILGLVEVFDDGSTKVVKELSAAGMEEGAWELQLEAGEWSALTLERLEAAAQAWREMLTEPQPVALEDASRALTERGAAPEVYGLGGWWLGVLSPTAGALDGPVRTQAVTSLQLVPLLFGQLSMPGKSVAEIAAAECPGGMTRAAFDEFVARTAALYHGVRRREIQQAFLRSVIEAKGLLPQGTRAQILDESVLDTSLLTWLATLVPSLGQHVALFVRPAFYAANQDALEVLARDHAVLTFTDPDALARSFISIREVTTYYGPRYEVLYSANHRLAQESPERALTILDGGRTVDRQQLALLLFAHVGNIEVGALTEAQVQLASQMVGLEEFYL